MQLASGAKLPDVDKICIVRANALGDYLLAVPAIEALRRAYPDSEIVLLGAPWAQDFLTDRPGPVDRVVTVPPTAGVRAPSADEPEDSARQDAFFAAMGREGFDLAIQMHGG